MLRTRSGQLSLANSLLSTTNAASNEQAVKLAGGVGVQHLLPVVDRALTTSTSVSPRLGALRAQVYALSAGCYDVWTQAQAYKCNLFCAYRLRT